jgi:hypothetical protein
LAADSRQWLRRFAAAGLGNLAASQTRTGQKDGGSQVNAPIVLLRATVAALAFLLAFAPAAHCDSLDVVRGDVSWHPFQTASTSGSAFWNNSSMDFNAECNIGYWLSGTGGCPQRGGLFLASSPRITPDYLGNASTGFQMTKAPDTTSVTVTNRMEVSAYRPSNEFGWFDTNAPSVLHPLFAGPNPLGATATFVPSGTYGFYIKSPENTSLSTGAGDTRTHFAVFQLAANSRYIIGAEDMWAYSDRDFNDIIVEIEVGTVPEPATMVLLGSGLAGIGAAARRRRTRNR